MTGDWDGLRVTAAGEPAGPAVLWLHGYTMRAEVWQPLWQRLSARLPGWRQVAVDLPWHGGSRALRPGEDLAALADSVAAHALGVRHVVALSFGTVLAAELAIRHPAQFRSWTLAAPALAGMPHEPAVEQRYRDLAVLYRQRGAGPHLTTLWMSSPPAIFAGLQGRPAARKWLRRLIDLHRWQELADGGMRPLVRRSQLPGELAGVTGPMLLLVGETELLTHRACARSLSAAVPSAVVREVPGCGHLAPLEDPDTVAPVLAAHLAAAEPPAGR